MKKILTILSVFLCVALMFTGCKKQVVSKKTLTFSNTQWGMTKEEVCKALKVPEDKLKLESSESKLECEEFILENYKYDKVPCDLILSFSNEDKTLYHVKLLFKSVEDIIKFDELLTKQLGNSEKTSNQSSGGTMHTWESIQTIKDHFGENHESYNQYVQIYIEKNGLFNEQTLKNKGVKDVSQYKESVMKSVTKDLGNIPLTTILLTIPNEPEGKYYGSVWFNGSYDANLRSMDTK